MRGLKSVYTHYKQVHIKKVSDKEIDPKKMTKVVLNMLRDFDISPMIINNKTTFLIWYFTGLVPYSKLNLQLRAILFSLCEGVYDYENKLFQAFVLMVFRMAIYTFDFTKGPLTENNYHNFCKFQCIQCFW